MPGPSSTDNGFPVLNTGSPTVTPAVYIVKNKHYYIINIYYKFPSLIDFTQQNCCQTKFKKVKRYKFLRRLEWLPCHPQDG